MRRLSRAAVIALAFLASGALGACGGDETDETDSSTETALDATAFRECILSGSPDVGNYGETDSPEQALVEATAEAELFETVRDDEGLVAFYVFDDATAADDFADDEFEATMATVAKAVAEFNDSEPVTPIVDTHDNVVVGSVPFDPGKEDELSEQVASDVSICAEEQTGAS